MIRRILCGICLPSPAFLIAVLCLMTGLLSGSRTSAATGETVAVCASEGGTVLQRADSAKSWSVVPEKGRLSVGDLLVGLPGAKIESGNAAIGLTFLADLDHRSPFPVKESAVRLEAPADEDIRLNLDRGRIQLANQKASGAAKARVTVGKASWEISLAEPGSVLALELYGRWPKGVPFRKDPGPKDEPTASLVFLVLRGKVVLKHEGNEHTLNAPPGPALLEWDSAAGQDDAPQRLEKLPAWAMESDDAEVKAKKAVLDRFRQAITKGAVNDVLQTFINSDSEGDRRLAIYIMAALDDLQDLGKAIRESKHPDVWETGILALRHWIGRKPGQDQILYHGLIETANYNPVQAETVLQLLHSFGDAELARPETYQMLIDYLDHDQLAIRGLAYWHLSRLVPAGREFGYSPVASKEEREAAIPKWRALVPPGKLPQRPRAMPPRPKVGNSDK